MIVTEKKKTPSILMKPDKELSLFTLLLYCNYDHPVTKVQVVKPIYSYDLLSERMEYSHKPKGDNITKFQCYSKLQSFLVNKVIPQGHFWCALLLDNHLQTGNADGELINICYQQWQAAPGTRKNFTNPRLSIDGIKCNAGQILYNQGVGLDRSSPTYARDYAQAVNAAIAAKNNARL